MFFLILTASIFSCGIKGPPLPPIDDEAVQLQRESEINQKAEENEAAVKAADKTEPSPTDEPKKKSKK